MDPPAGFDRLMNIFEKVLTLYIKIGGWGFFRVICFFG